jgi:hypothetical protein
LKGDLAEATIEFLAPIQQRVKEITDEELDALLERGPGQGRATLRPRRSRTSINESGFARRRRA